MTTPPTPPSLPDSDPRNPLDIRLMDGPHHGQTLRFDTPRDHTKPILLSSNPDHSPSAPFFAEYRATDRVDPYTGLRIYRYIGIGIDGSSIKAGSLRKTPPPNPLFAKPPATSYTKDYRS